MGFPSGRESFYEEAREVNAVLFVSMPPLSNDNFSKYQNLLNEKLMENKDREEAKKKPRRRL